MQHTDLIAKLQQQSAAFGSVVPFDPGNDKLIKLDLSNENLLLPPGILSDTKKFTAYINDMLKNAGARYAIGGYAEHRTLYEKSELFNGRTEEAEPRRFHLGIDIWGQPYTKVIAPLDGIVHSFAFNNNFGDYGATLILSHVLNGSSFYTLYGHLSLSSIKDKQEGETVKKGDVIGEFGIPMENGHWPPHLHFQLIREIDSWKGDYPGVCCYSERDAYLVNSPDPDLVLQLLQYAG